MDIYIYIYIYMFVLFLFVLALEKISGVGTASKRPDKHVLSSTLCFLARGVECPIFTSPASD